MKDRNNVSHRFENHLKIQSFEEPYDLDEIRNDEQNIVDPVPDLSCLISTKDTQLREQRLLLFRRKDTELDHCSDDFLVVAIHFRFPLV